MKAKPEWSLLPAKWKVAIELNDGSLVGGTSADDLLDRWYRLASWIAPTAGSRGAIAERVERLHGVTLDVDTDALSFLFAGAAAGAWRLLTR